MLPRTTSPFQDAEDNSVSKGTLGRKIETAYYIMLVVLILEVKKHSKLLKPSFLLRAEQNLIYFAGS